MVVNLTTYDYLRINYMKRLALFRLCGIVQWSGVASGPHKLVMLPGGGGGVRSRDGLAEYCFKIEGNTYPIHLWLCSLSCVHVSD